jgi:hypothetical protein
MALALDVALKLRHVEINDAEVYVGSGYAVGNGAAAGNLLLAFDVARTD